MPKLLSQYEWNGWFYCLADLDSGTKIELKSKDGKDFAALMEKYNTLALAPVVDTQQKELDDYAKQQWPTLAKGAAVKTPFTTEKSIAEWVDKAALVVGPPTAITKMAAMEGVV